MTGIAYMVVLSGCVHRAWVIYSNNLIITILIIIRVTDEASTADDREIEIALKMMSI